MSGAAIRERLRQRRRRVVKRHGKRLIRSLAGYLGRHSGIPDTPVIDPAHFPWARELRSDWKAVRAELDAFLAHRERLPRCQDISPDQSRIAPDDGWHTIVLYGFGHRCRAICERCPETSRLLGRVPHLRTALFSILAPGRRIPLHRGITKGVIRCHLGLVVPRRAGRCGMIVGGQRVEWAQGDVVFFDDTYPHAVWNDTDEERVVLLLDFERPLDRRGRLVARLLLAGLRRTGYFRDAYRNQRAWEARYLRAVGSGPPAR
jgi:aspartyl/asparaginyl beta-hydroxylase (cupin superfamily)